MLAPNPRYQFPHITFAVIYALLTGGASYAAINSMFPALWALLGASVMSVIYLSMLIGTFRPNPSRIKVTLFTYREENLVVWASMFISASLCFSLGFAIAFRQAGLPLPWQLLLPVGFAFGYGVMQLFQRNFRPTLAHR